MDEDVDKGVFGSLAGAAGDEAERSARGGRKRLRCAVRNQVLFQPASLDELVAADHQARVVWAFVCELDLSELVDRIAAVERGKGRAATDPRILVALWLYATLDGVGSARELERLCESHIAYRWICGGVTINHHLLSNFRTEHVELLDRLLTNSVAALLEQGLASLERVAQDGMKVRASAGAASFRRRPTLEQALAEAEEQVTALRAELESDPAASKNRQRTARARAATERAERIRQALAQIPNIEAAKKPKDRDKARASTTDADARVMKMGDGGFRPAYNVQFATATDSLIITGVEVTNSGGDQGQLLPMIEQHVERYGEQPREALVDGGFVKKDDIDALGTPLNSTADESQPASSPKDAAAPQNATKVYAPVMKSKDAQRDPHTPRDDDSPAVAEWRQRMATPEAKEIYKQRAATAECSNAHARNRGLQQFPVRGLRKVKAVALWYALAHNLIRTVALRAAVAAAAG
jgi:transposase